MRRRYIRYDWITNIIDNGGSDLLQPGERVEGEDEGTRARSNTFRIKITRK